MKKLISFVILSCITIGQGSAHATGCYNSTLIATAYYSPLPDQTYYTMGNFQAEKRLQGNGTHGASGRAVFDGMLAASSNYAFGTQITIEGRGIGQVEDRGGAIVRAGQRGYEHDRIDIRMGYGDEGMRRAMTWGKRTVSATICPSNTYTSDQLGAGISDRRPATNNHKIHQLQQTLTTGGYTRTPLESGHIDTQTTQAICHYQRTHNLLTPEKECGTYDDKTRTHIENTTTQRELPNDTPFAIGEQSDDITALQHQLYLEGYYEGYMHGQYDDKTHQARLLHHKIITIATKHLTQA